jgi:hypothetical protein
MATISRFLNFRLLPQEFEEDILQKYNIHPDKVLVVTVVTDTTGNMGTFGRFLRERLSVQHIYCVDHQIHRTAILARTDTNISNGSGTTFRDLMQFFNSSTQALEKLLALMKYANLKPVKPIQDNTTRWWSTYNSISRYLDDGELLIPQF